MSDEIKNGDDKIKGVIFYPTSEWSINFEIKLRKELRELKKNIEIEKEKNENRRA